MKTHHNKLKDQTLSLQNTVKRKNSPKKAKKQVIGGTIVFLIILLTPFLFYIYKSFPNSQVWKTSFFEWHTNFNTWFDYAWLLFGKIIPIVLLLVWFFTCKHWWYWAILAPLGMYIFQLWGIVEQSYRIDEVELLYLYPFMFILMPALFLIRAHLLFSLRADDLEQLEKDLRKKRTLWGQVMDLFN